MKYKKIVILVSIVLSLNTLVGCSNNTQKTQNTENSISKEEQDKTTDDAKTTKIEGRKEEFLGRLDCIQKQINDLPEKKQYDQGVSSVGGIYSATSYYMYDEALNEIYDLLKGQLSSDEMKNLEKEEVKWITNKENKEKELDKQSASTITRYSVLCELTKNRCYELVKYYMTDSKIRINASKQDYISKLDNIENEILSSQEYKNAATGVTHDMLVLADKKYNEWDNELNEIYSILKQQLPSNEMTKLNKEEVLWIAQKENRAKKSKEDQGNDSQLGNVSYQASLADWTQRRCYELVYRYMK
ncbi:lysozyme inhibitor LprI family protein [Clostridium sp. YIM B02551]|uniref:lysozyme inhibitor LprI family protein n=1 Tax=Clostridium sp. YIM B02551 TaxID=2910679 RepID=UPI001EEC7275|nr:lysozyme inhibitor LprI family protein [Clostridium sp. YIM B02551]